MTQLANEAVARVSAQGFTIDPMTVRERVTRKFHQRVEELLNMSSAELQALMKDDAASVGDVMIAATIARGMSGSMKHTKLIWERIMGATLKVELEANRPPAEGEARPYRSVPAETLIAAVAMFAEPKEQRVVKDIGGSGEDGGRVEAKTEDRP